jgi:acyl-CoA dehydrogenase
VTWQYDQKDALPQFILRGAFDAGLMNGDNSKAYGGLELGITEAALITEEIAAACPGLATVIFDNSLAMEPLIQSYNAVMSTIATRRRRNAPTVFPQTTFKKVWQKD